MRIFSHPLWSEADVFMIVLKQTNMKFIIQDKCLYRKEDMVDKRGRKRWLSEFKKECDEREAEKLHDLLAFV
jgi:hypothetical protein